MYAQILHGTVKEWVVAIGWYGVGWYHAWRHFRGKGSSSKPNQTQ